MKCLPALDFTGLLALLAKVSKRAIVEGVTSSEIHYVVLYSSNVTEDEYVKAEGQHLINKLFDGKAKTWWRLLPEWVAERGRY